MQKHPDEHGIHDGNDPADDLQDEVLDRAVDDGAKICTCACESCLAVRPA